MKIAIIGAGVIGRLMALSLIEKQSNVTIFDKNLLTEPNNAAQVSAGMLCPLGEIIHASNHVVELGLHSLGLWSGILNSLNALDPEQQSVFFEQRGSLAVSFTQDQSCFAQLQQDLTHKAVYQQADIEHLNREQLYELEPALAKFNQGMFLATEGQLCNRSFLQSSSRALNQHCQIMEPTLMTSESIAKLAKDYDWVIDCRGAGAIGDTQPGDAQSDIDSPTLRGIRGEVIRVRCTDVTLERPVRIVHPRASIYIVPKPNHEFVIGATEVESHSDHPITVRSTLELLSTAYAAHSGFAEAEVLEMDTGIRAAYPDHAPKISRHQNLLSINGLYRHGWLVGPAITEQAINLITGNAHASLH